MIRDISTLNHSSSSKSNSSSGLATTGPLAKLNSETQLINNLSLIKISHSENISYKGQAAQLLHATDNKQNAITLVNKGPAINVDPAKQIQIKATPSQVVLTLPNTPSSVLGQPNQISLASQVSYLTATSNSTTPSQGAIQTLVSDGKNEFPILTKTPLKAGETIRVMVDTNNNMQVLPFKPSHTGSIQAEALRQSLPKQLSAEDMSQLLKQLQTINQTSSRQLSPQEQQTLRQLIQTIPNLASLTDSPESMKQAIQTSGHFSESLLKENTQTLSSDLKLNLTKLASHSNQINEAALGPKVSHLPTEQIAGAVERITTQQLRHFSDVNQTGVQNYPLHLEIPIRDGQTNHLIQMLVNQDSSTAHLSEQERKWLVKLKFDFEETGRFEARTSIQDNKVGILFATEDKETNQAIKQHLGDLKSSLEEKDIHVERLDAFHSKLREDHSLPGKTQSLIDVRT